eukprot:gene12183-biopygen10742
MLDRLSQSSRGMPKRSWSDCAAGKYHCQVKATCGARVVRLSQMLLEAVSARHTRSSSRRRCPTSRRRKAAEGEGPCTEEGTGRRPQRPRNALQPPITETRDWHAPPAY